LNDMRSSESRLTIRAPRRIEESISSDPERAEAADAP
jgi:hypothetical protein